MILCCLPLLCACEGAGELDEVEASGKAISFSSDIADQGQGLTRASALAKDFIVYGYKYAGASESEIFPGWTVKCQQNTDNTYSYNYLGVNGQTQMYWDLSATEYRFWATAGNGWDRAGKTLSANNQSLRMGTTGIAATDLGNDCNLYASVVQRTSPIDPSTVSLQFNHTCSQVSVYFYYDVMPSGVTGMQIRNVAFTPVATPAKADKIFKTGKVQVQYPGSLTDNAQETVTVIGNNDDTRPGLDFIVTSPLTSTNGNTVSNAIQAEIPHSSGFELPDMPGQDLTRSTPGVTPYKYYYPLPMGDQNPDFELTVYITQLDGDGNELPTQKRSAIIPATYMHWKSNYAYRYFFKITADASDPIVCDVQIEPWKYGGSQEEEWKNW